MVGKSEEWACEPETVVVVSAMVFACMLCVYSSPNSLNSMSCGVSDRTGLPDLWCFCL